MRSESSLKGSVITELAEDIQKLMAGGELSRRRVEDRLTPDDLTVLDRGITVSKWYAVEFYRRCAELLRDTVGGGRNEYLRERGFKKGKRLIEAGLYQQMEYATRAKVMEETSPQRRFAAYGHDLRLFVTLSQSLLNFTRWSTLEDTDHQHRYVIVVDEAAQYPHALAWATEGLIESMATEHGLARLWIHDRERSDRVVFRMSRSL